MSGKKIVVLGTGGTIAGLAPSQGGGRGVAPQGDAGLGHLGYRAAQLRVADLLAAIPQLASVPLVTEQVAQVDSKDMGPAVWQTLAARCAHWLHQPEVQGLVLTHGTDTLEETAYFLHRVLSPTKPLVLTCAMRPADAMSPDGPQNLVDAVAVARSTGARGVLAVCAGQIHGPREVSKVHPYRLDAFSSGEAGPVGLVEEGRVRLLRPWPEGEEGLGARSYAASSAAQFTTQLATQFAAGVARHAPAQWPRVEIVMNHAGADGAVVDALVSSGVQGLVAAGTGNGTLSEGLEAALLRAQQSGVAVWRVSRCALGQVLPQRGDVLSAVSGLSPVKARVALQLELLAGRE